MKNRKIQAKLKSITGKLSAEDLEDLEEDFDFYDDPKEEELKKTKETGYILADKFKRKVSHENVDGRSEGNV